MPWNHQRSSSILSCGNPYGQDGLQSSSKGQGKNVGGTIQPKQHGRLEILEGPRHASRQKQTTMVGKTIGYPYPPSKSKFFPNKNSKSQEERLLGTLLQFMYPKIQRYAIHSKTFLGLEKKSKRRSIAQPVSQNRTSQSALHRCPEHVSSQMVPTRYNSLGHPWYLPTMSFGTSSNNLGQFVSKPEYLLYSSSVQTLVSAFGSRIFGICPLRICSILYIQ